MSYDPIKKQDKVLVCSKELKIFKVCVVLGVEKKKLLSIATYRLKTENEEVMIRKDQCEIFQKLLVGQFDATKILKADLPDYWVWDTKDGISYGDHDYGGDWRRIINIDETQVTLASFYIGSFQAVHYSHDKYTLDGRRSKEEKRELFWKPREKKA